jgi:hypothetical protein
MAQAGTDQSIQASAGLELIEAAQSTKDLLTHFLAFPHAADDLEILEGTGGFDSKKHCCWLGATSSNNKSFTEAIKKLICVNFLALHFEVAKQKSPAKPLQYLNALKKNPANCRRPARLGLQAKSEALAGAKKFISDGLASELLSAKIDRVFVGSDGYATAHRYMEANDQIGEIASL